MAAHSRRVIGFGGALLLAGGVIAGAPATAVPMAAQPSQAVARSVATDRVTRLVPAWRSGVFAGFSVRRDVAFGTWRGSPITSATDFQAAASWNALESSDRLIQAWRGHHRGIRLSIAVPLWAGLGDHMRTAASGYYDGRFKKMAAGLIAAGLGHSILRLGWEFNGSWFGWGITHTTQNSPATKARAQLRAERAVEFARAWRHIVGAIRSVPGEHFRFDWCVSAGRHYPDVALAYPGDAYVDYIGDDVYDWNRDRLENAASRWRETVEQRTGLAWQVRFAGAHHKPLSFPEWALVSDALHPSESGNDDPNFVRNMYRWFDHHDVAYEDYFDFDPYLGLSSGLTTGNGQFKFARELYRRLWSRLPLVRAAG